MRNEGQPAEADVKRHFAGDREIHVDHVEATGVPFLDGKHAAVSVLIDRATFRLNGQSFVIESDSDHTDPDTDMEEPDAKRRVVGLPREKTEPSAERDHTPGARVATARTRELRYDSE